MWGLYPIPHILFCLDTKKYAKRVKTSPTSLEKLTLGRLKSSKLIPTEYVGTQTRTIFNRLPHLFFGSSDEVSPNSKGCSKINTYDSIHYK